MEQFSLNKWLQDKNRKVVTRDNKPVRIVCCDVKGSFPILALIVCNGERDTKVGEEYPCCYKVDGACPVSDSYDLFFADEEGLSEFESKLFSVISEVWQNYMLGREIDFAETVKEYSGELLDLARKDFEKDNVIFDKDTHLKICEQYYYNGKRDALKDLPKWKKITDKTDLSLTLSNG